MKRTFAKFFRFLIILFFVSFSAFLYAEERTVWKYSFDKAGPDNNLEIKGGSLHGPLPEGVSQNFLGWQTSSLKSERLKEEGKTFFRFTADRIFGGSPQLTVRVPELEPSKYYRLTATVRNRSDGGFALYLRENPVPYASIGPALSLEFSDEWQTESVFLQFRKPASNKYSLFFAFSGSGTFDLQEFSIIETDRESYLAQERGMSKKNAMIVNRPDPKWRNYINASCFPFGVPAGWNCRRGSAVLSDDRSGPSGQNAILVKPDFGEIETPQIFSAPFQVPDPNKTYTVSFSCKGSAPIACNGKMFNPAGNWRRFDFPIRIPQGEAGAFLDFSSS
ncbi:MAG: hypothetical protein Q4G69_04980 [Planctomycetia bacterium]|nr:hypothetical protein [Planctomycetia bacterium]